jgi:hypothetical protein
MFLLALLSAKRSSQQNVQFCPSRLGVIEQIRSLVGADADSLDVLFQAAAGMKPDHLASGIFMQQDLAGFSCTLPQPLRICAFVSLW